MIYVIYLKRLNTYIFFLKNNLEYLVEIFCGSSNIED